MPVDNRNDILPRARGEAGRIEQEAQGYRAQVISLAEGDTKGFHAVYDAYRRAPDATAWRLYLDSLDELFRRATRVVLDPSGKGAASLYPYLPSPELVRNAQGASSPSTASASKP